MTRSILIKNAKYVKDETYCSNTCCCGSQSPVTWMGDKIRRNDPLPCDSGRKLKKCCGQFI